MSAQSKAPESKFAYVVIAARRARQLMAGAPPLFDNPHSQKATRIALEELDHGLLEFELPEVPAEEDKESKRRK